MEAAHDLGSSARRVAATLVEIARTRLELGAVELAEERLRLAQQALAATLALFCLGVGLVLGVLGLAWWVGPEHRATVLGASALLALAAAAAAAAWWRRIVRTRGAPLQATLDQLRADAQALATERGA
ncbi:MAG TPA: phage holin family protein [Burkholderiaceae bacterium]|nr:phage holin family protein [Burkholderiaceae bacterium]